MLGSSCLRQSCPLVARAVCSRRMELTATACGRHVRTRESCASTRPEQGGKHGRTQIWPLRVGDLADEVAGRRGVLSLEVLVSSKRKFERKPSDFNSAKWTAEHTQLVNARAERLRADGYAVYLEGQNEFRLKGRVGATLAGKADIVAVKEGDACVIDCKTGAEHHSDKMQVLLYMLVLPLTVDHCRGKALRGEVQYKADVVHIAPTEVDEAFREMFRSNMGLAASEDAPAKTPSYSECRFCDITSADCPDRVDEATTVMETDLF